MSSRSVRFAASDEIFHIETRPELEQFDLWCTSDDFEDFRDDAKVAARKLLKNESSIVRDMEKTYQAARDLAKQAPVSNPWTSGTASGSQLLQDWTSLSVSGRGLERFCISQETKVAHHQETLAARNVVLNLQQLLKGKSKTGSMEMIASAYASFSLLFALRAQMSALADAQTLVHENILIAVPGSGKKEKRSSRKSSPSNTAILGRTGSALVPLRSA